MCIKTIEDFSNYLIKNSGFSEYTIHGFISFLGFNLNGTEKELQSISNILLSYTKYLENKGIPGFSNYKKAVQFFKSHQRNIAVHLVKKAKSLDLDVLYMISKIFPLNSDYVSFNDIETVLWDKDYISYLDYIYNTLAWYVLEEISIIWRNYLEKNKTIAA